MSRKFPGMEATFDIEGEAEKIEQYSKRASNSKEIIIRLIQTKMGLLRKILSESKTFHGMKNIRWERDENRLLTAFERTTNRQDRYVRILKGMNKKFSRSLDKIFIRVEELKRIQIQGVDLTPFAQALNQYNSAFSVMIAHTDRALMAVRDNLHWEAQFIFVWKRSWRNFVHWFRRKSSLLENFSKKVRELIQGCKKDLVKCREFTDEIHPLIETIRVKGEEVIRLLDEYAARFRNNIVIMKVVDRIRTVVERADDDAKLGAAVIGGLIGYSLGSLSD